jgi:hypothetical protein
MHVDPLRAARAGLTVRDVQDQLETMLRGSAETRIQKGERLMGIRTRFAAAARSDLAAIRRLPIQTPEGEPVPLAHLAAIRTTRGQAEIDRENLASVVSVTARIAGRDLGSTITEIQHTLRKDLVLPRGVSLVYGGTYQTQQESFRGLAMVLGLAVVFVFLVLLFEFESFRVPLAVFLINLPSLFGVGGGAVADARDVQSVELRGRDPGRGHRRRKRHLPAALRRPLPASRHAARRSAGVGLPGAGAADPDDDVRGGVRAPAARDRVGRRHPDAANPWPSQSSAASRSRRSCSSSLSPCSSGCCTAKVLGRSPEALRG